MSYSMFPHCFHRYLPKEQQNTLRLRDRSWERTEYVGTLIIISPVTPITHLYPGASLPNVTFENVDNQPFIHFLATSYTLFSNQQQIWNTQIKEDRSRIYQWISDLLWDHKQLKFVAFQHNFGQFCSMLDNFLQLCLSCRRHIDPELPRDTPAPNIATCRGHAHICLAQVVFEFVCECVFIFGLLALLLCIKLPHATDKGIGDIVL